MNKLKNMLIAMIAIFALSTSAFAGTIGLGLTGNVAAISGSGTGTEGTAADESPQTAEVSDTTGIVSLFAEYTFDRFNGFTLGIDMIPGAANVSKGLTRTDTNNAHLEESGSATSTTITHVAGARAFAVGDTVTISGHTGTAANTAMNQVFTVASVSSPTVAVLTGSGMTSSGSAYSSGTIIATFSMAAAGNLCHVECANRGLCNYAIGQCQCFGSWKGAACTTQVTHQTKSQLE